MLKKKIGLALIVLLAVLFFTPGKIYAGTCTCFFNSTGRVWVLPDSDDCADDEYASGCSGTSNRTCECIKKEKSGLAANSCTCNMSGSITANNCQGDTPVPYCSTRSEPVCRCSKDGSIGTIKNNNKNNNNNNNETSVYDPSCTKNGKEGINTAIGCIPVEIGGFVPWLMTWLFGVAGGIAFLLMVYGFILIATSSGDEKKIQGAKETITSAIVGLLVCVFSVFILRLITVNILQIPGF